MEGPEAGCVGLWVWVWVWVCRRSVRDEIGRSNDKEAEGIRRGWRVKGQQVSAEELCRGVKQPTTLSPVAESRAGLSARTACCCALLLSLLAPGLFLTSEEEAGTVKDTGDDGVYAIREKPLRTYSSLFSQWVSRPDAYHIGLASGGGTAVHAGSQGVGRSRWSEAR